MSVVVGVKENKGGAVKGAPQTQEIQKSKKKSEKGKEDAK